MKSKLEVRRYTQGARAEAAEATGQRIVDAFLSRLMSQWYDEITLDRVAADAGVTVQTVIRRFGGKEGLLTAAVQTFTKQVDARRAAPRDDVDAVVRHLLADYEEAGDGVVRMLSLEGRHPALKEVLDFGRGEHRRWVTEAFAGSLQKVDAGGRQRAADALVVATDVYTWKLLRRDMGRSPAATSHIIRQMVNGIIAGL